MEEKKETDIQQIVNHFFYKQGLELDDIKEQAKSGEINYARHTRAAKQLLTLVETVDKAKQAIDTMDKWSKDTGLDYTIDTTIKRWWEIKHLI